VQYKKPIVHLLLQLRAPEQLLAQSLYFQEPLKNHLKEAELFKEKTGKFFRNQRLCGKMSNSKQNSE
jgi:hypothetical protein